MCVCVHILFVCFVFGLAALVAFFGFCVIPP